jgi:hypothetical protein
LDKEGFVDRGLRRFLIDTAVFPISYIGAMNVTGPLASWVGHRRPQVGAANPDVDHVLDSLAGETNPRS